MLADSGITGTVAAPSSAAARPVDALEASGSRSGSSGDSMLGRMLIRRGLATATEVEECASIALGSANAPMPRSFLQILLERHIVTVSQLQRLKADAESDRAALHIPGFEVIRKLGQGAMGAVYLGRQISLDRLVAIKVLPSKFCTDPKFVERFYREGRAAGRLSDQNVVGAYDVGQVGNSHYFVMEFVDGETVFDLIERSKRIPEKDALRIVRQVASALMHAHERGFIHRDVKPKNIMISKAGVVKLADLGLARALDDKATAMDEEGKAYGTPYYISPEQIRAAEDVGPPSDIYGLGATLYHMLTGRVPFTAANSRAVMTKHLKEALVPPDHINPEISQGVAEIVEMMLAKKVADRYRTAAELIEDIDCALAGNRPKHASKSDGLSELQASAAASLPDEPVRMGERTLLGTAAGLVTVILLGASILGNFALLFALLRK